MTATKPRREKDSMGLTRSGRSKMKGRRPPSKKQLDTQSNCKQLWKAGNAYKGFCPWRVGDTLPSIEKALVDELATSCSFCNPRAGDAADGTVAEKGFKCGRCFYDTYVKPRRPCLVQLHRRTDVAAFEDAKAPLSGCPAMTMWRDLHYLVEKAGSEVLDVEERGSSKGDKFGHGHYLRLSLKEIVQRLCGGDSSLYVTTQRIPSNKFGPKRLTGPPLSGRLAADFPAYPALLGGLLPSQFNIWLGSSEQGSSTGLHHDYHDNFYVLLRGKKEFRLFSPSLVGFLRPKGFGPKCKVHSNGLISYMKGIREDGAHATALVSWRQQRLDAINENIEKTSARIDRINSKLEDPMDCLKIAQLKTDIQALKDDAEREQDLLESCLDACLEVADSGADLSGSSSEDDMLQEGRLNIEGSIPDSFCEKNCTEANEESWQGPLNETNVCGRYWKISMVEGDILYLPAGWFHEVISFSSDSSSPGIGPEAQSIHLAFNIWCHPPAWGAPFEQPYVDDLWKDIALRQVELQHQLCRGKPNAGNE